MTIIEAVHKKDDKSGGHNGIFLPELSRLTGLDSGTLKEKLNELYQEKKIIIREGIHGKMIYPNDL